MVNFFTNYISNLPTELHGILIIRELIYLLIKVDAMLFLVLTLKGCGLGDLNKSLQTFFMNDTN